MSDYQHHIHPASPAPRPPTEWNFNDFLSPPRNQPDRPSVEGRCLFLYPIYSLYHTPFIVMLLVFATASLWEAAPWLTANYAPSSFQQNPVVTEAPQNSKTYVFSNVTKNRIIWCDLVHNLLFMLYDKAWTASWVSTFRSASSFLINPHHNRYEFRQSYLTISSFWTIQFLNLSLLQIESLHTNLTFMEEISSNGIARQKDIYILINATKLLSRELYQFIFFKKKKSH